MDGIKLIKRYIAAYNMFDIDGMLETLHGDIVFENVQGGKVNLKLVGKSAFREQAEKAAKLFAERQINITSLAVEDNSIKVEIDYSAILADSKNEHIQGGESLNLKGSSEFVITDNKIFLIRDIS